MSPGRYDSLASPHSCVEMEFSSMQSASSSVHFPANNDKMLYDHDLVMVFPRREGGEMKKPDDFTMNSFVQLLLGKDTTRSQRLNKVVIDPFQRVLRTSRCFLDERGRDVAMDTSHDHSEQGEQRRLMRQQQLLEHEYVQFIGNSDATTETRFCELVATAIARRIQLACGLTTRMFLSCDADEIIMTIKADNNDLRIEADRANYRLQVSNKPFDETLHQNKLSKLRHEIGDQEWQKSMDHLQNTRGCANEEAEAPEMDPLLVSRGQEFHPELRKALDLYGHTEEADGLFVHDDTFRRLQGSHWTRFVTSIFGLPYDPLTYFAPFAEYRHEDKYQPYYRQYPIKWEEKKEETLFSQKDRIRLAEGIVERHINADALESAGYLVGQMFALHDPQALLDLRHSWALHWTMLYQPLHKIRYYFGEKIALYFAWLEFYTKMLVFPAVAGLITFVYIEARQAATGTNQQGYILIAFAVFVVLWSSLFSELWKRKNGLLDSLWGLSGLHQSFRYRPQFRGTKSYHPVTDSEEVTFESKLKRRRAFLVSVVVVTLMVGIVIVALFGLFLLKNWINDKDNLKNSHISAEYQTPLTFAVTVVNAIQILVLNTVYRNVARKLNDYENHRTDAEYENYLVIKVFLFQFCNSFASFFYIAFVKRLAEGSCLYEDDCMQELRDQLLTLFIIRIVVGNVTEVAVPYLKYRYQLFAERKAAIIGEKTGHNYIEEQAKLVPYESNEAFEDYNEMVIQYGFINLFVVAFPLTPLLALANNVLEVHIDAVKLCFVHRRPFPHPAKDIGVWFYILRFMTYIALGTNTALILWTSDLFEDQSGTARALGFVVACQVCLVLAILVERVVPNTPHEIKLIQERYEHIVNVVFKGLFEGDDSTLNEVAESLDLQIYPNQEWEESKQHFA
ncbi:Protein required for meiotic chromosome segregation [Plasmopara halstedii]|uniref:Protein required for meiotic chromosome segregation n=1 Tax=Plasmopara halstedii TaxID=4781 RepID=A0A0P1AGX2_PLAHL|nr:Protein required for meiotic chromosome segregation [Plasmopara halstedii]CEG40388.1 Protein required for meiotic chromosome segregation [Plasmopara halstedii]|eukprot:XP_024576757.1 Protein required for meiotic chromosome segregation [Plasmopara halstedii]